MKTSIFTTSDESHVHFANREYGNGPSEIRIRGERQRAGVVVEGGEARSERNAGDVVLNQAVDVDDGGGVAELDAGDEDEHHGDHRVHGLEHFALASFSSRH